MKLTNKEGPMFIKVEKRDGELIPVSVMIGGITFNDDDIWALINSLDHSKTLLEIDSNISLSIGKTKLSADDCEQISVVLSGMF